MIPPNPFALGPMAILLALLAVTSIAGSFRVGRPPFVLAIATSIAGLGGALGWSEGSYAGMVVTWTALVSLVLLVLVLPVTLLLRAAQKPGRKTPDEPEAPRMGRRELVLRGASFALPAVALAGGPTALWEATSPTKVRRLPLKVPGLPSSLAGTCILHLSDLHLGSSKTSDDLRALLDGARKPDLVLVTGDVADDLGELGRALDLLGGFGPPVYASLGNHEYFRGVERVVALFRDSGVRLLRDAHEIVRVRGTDVVLAGIDDPGFGAPTDAFFERAIDRALLGAPSRAFRILMSHRPRALDAASRRDVGLVLSGHTHGAQLGLLGRSLLEPLLPREYLWGRYQRRTTTLYTSSGFGHWFPFRLGCPPEAPCIELAP